MLLLTLTLAQAHGTATWLSAAAMRACCCPVPARARQSLPPSPPRTAHCLHPCRVAVKLARACPASVVYGAVVVPRVVTHTGLLPAARQVLVSCVVPAGLKHLYLSINGITAAACDDLGLILRTLSSTLQVSTRILGRRTRLFHLSLFPTASRMGFTQDPSTHRSRWGSS